MVRQSVVALCAIAVLCTFAQASPTYQGSLSTADGGLIAMGTWADGITLGWTVQQNENGSWHYRYDFTRGYVDGHLVGGALSHLLLETSLNFTQADVLNATPQNELEGPAWFGPGDGASNPNLPEPLFGMKFADFGQGSEGETTTIHFDSPRAPTWGDFYAKSGGKVNANTVYNAGFLTTDPLTAAANGSIGNHILVPDTATSTVPAPGAVILGSIGAGLISWLRRRKTL